jgi:hypothetical protein
VAIESTANKHVSYSRAERRAGGIAVRAIDHLVFSLLYCIVGVRMSEREGSTMFFNKSASVHYVTVQYSVHAVLCGTEEAKEECARVLHGNHVRWSCSSRHDQRFPLRSAGFLCLVMEDKQNCVG